MARYPKIESIGSIGSIILAILEVQVYHISKKRIVVFQGTPPHFHVNLEERVHWTGPAGSQVSTIIETLHIPWYIPKGSATPVEIMISAPF